jgi:hypothetical protein
VVNHAPTNQINQTNHSDQPINQSTKLTNQMTQPTMPTISTKRRPTKRWPTNRANPRLNDTHVRLTDAELAKITANQKKAGFSSIAAYMRARALDDGQLSDRDKYYERRLLQTHCRIAEVIERGPESPGQQAALTEIKKMIGELVRA